MAKVFETFKHDIKRKFDDVMTVEDSDSIKAIDIEEYVLTQNVEDYCKTHIEIRLVQVFGLEDSSEPENHIY